MMTAYQPPASLTAADMAAYDFGMSTPRQGGTPRRTQVRFGRTAALQHC
jgi:hypothetical protein